MKKIIIALILIIILGLSGCNMLGNKNSIYSTFSNEELGELFNQQRSSAEINKTYEYSYLTPEGELLCLDDSHGNRFEYYSLGPYIFDEQLDKENEEYIGRTYPLINYRWLGSYYLTKFDNGIIENSKESEDYYIFTIADRNLDIKSFINTDHVQVVLLNWTAEYALMWLNYEIIAGAHYFTNDTRHYSNGESNTEGKIIRYTLNFNEETTIEEKNNGMMRHYDDYLYYIAKEDYEEFRGGNLYRVKLDGTKKEILTDEHCLDYCATEDGIVYLHEEDDKISVLYKGVVDYINFKEMSREEYNAYTAYIETSNIQAKKLHEFDRENGHAYIIAGQIDGTTYICDCTDLTCSHMIYRTKIYALSSEKIEMVKQCNIKLANKYNFYTEIYDYYIPFVKDECIYYVTVSGIREYNTKTGESKLIAETYDSGMIKSD